MTARERAASHPTLSRHHATIVQLFAALSDREGARQALRAAAAMPLESPADLEALAFAAFRIDDHDMARDLYDRFTRLVPGDGLGWYNLASACRNLGAIDAAEAACERSIAVRPDLMQAVLLRSQLRTQTIRANHVDEIRGMLAATRGETSDRIFAHYALGKELDDLGDHDAAFAQFSAGAAERRRTLDYDVSGDVHKLHRIAQTFDADRLARAPQLNTPVRHGFVLGLPRSGTTMLERILTNHPDARSNGETDNLLTALMDGTPTSGADVFDRVAAADPMTVGESYDRLAGPGRLVVEKLPLNFLYVGAVRLTLPHARVILMHRAPMDNLFAMFSTLFGAAYPFSYDLRDLGAYHIAYARLIAHWQRRLPELVLTMRYEDVVHDPSRFGSLAAGHVGLAWNDSMAAVERNASASTTASAVQVRRPIYRTAIGRWRNYARHLEPLRRTLEAAGLDPEA